MHKLSNKNIDINKINIKNQAIGTQLKMINIIYIDESS